MSKKRRKHTEFDYRAADARLAILATRIHAQAPTFVSRPEPRCDATVGEITKTAKALPPRFGHCPRCAQGPFKVDGPEFGIHIRVECPKRLFHARPDPTKSRCVGTKAKMRERYRPATLATIWQDREVRGEGTTRSSHYNVFPSGVSGKTSSARFLNAYKRSGLDYTITLSVEGPGFLMRWTEVRCDLRGFTTKS